MLKISKETARLHLGPSANSGLNQQSDLRAELLGKATRPELDTLRFSGLGMAMTSPKKEELVTLLKGRSPQELAAVRKLYLAQNGVSLEQVIDRHFSSEDRVELQAFARHGRLRDSDALESALVDDQNDQIHRLIKRRGGSELDQLRKEYRGTYGKELDGRVLDTLRGKDQEIARVLLAGEPEARPGESAESLARRQGDYVSKQLEIALRRDPMQPTNPKRVLDALHDHSPEVLLEAARLYQERTGHDLREALKDNLTGANEDLALNYLDDGKESPIEKLRRAFDGNNDEDLIRRTLRDLTPEQRKELQTTHKSEVSKLFDELNDQETVEMKGLLGKGKLDNADRLSMAVADGADKGIIGALKAMTPQERSALGQDKGRLAATLDKLDSDERAEVLRLIGTGRMSAAAELRHAETPEEVYRAAAWAKKTGETDELRRMMAPLPMGGRLPKVEVSAERFRAHLEKGELKPSQAISLENDEDRLKATLRAMSARELKDVAGSPQALERLADELDKKGMAEARALLTRGPLPAHESLRHAIVQEDDKRVRELMGEIRDDRQRTELLTKYRSTYRSEVLNDLRDVLGSDDLRKADQAMRLDGRDAVEIGARVRDDMFADRDDNGLASQVSNGLLDAFSSAGQNMDDQARETEAMLRANRRTGQHGLEDLRAKENSFQGAREQMHVERQKIASIAVSVVSGIVTGGLGGLSMSAGVIGQLMRASWATRGLSLAGGASLSAGARVGAEALFRGNGFGTAKDVSRAARSGAIEGVAAVTGGFLGRAASGGAARLGATERATEVTGSVVRDGIENGISVLPELSNSGADTAFMTIAMAGAGLKGGLSTRLETVLEKKGWWRPTLNFALSSGAGAGVGAAESALRGTLVDELQ